MNTTLDDLRIGNIVEYQGPLGHYQYVHIIAIEPADDGRQVFTFRNPYETGKVFVGYTEHVRHISLRDANLEMLGFVQDKNTKRHSRGTMEITAYTYPEGTDRRNMTLVMTTFKILPMGFPNVPTLEEVEKYTISIPYLHSLQNYCSDKKKDDLDFSVFK